MADTIHGDFETRSAVQLRGDESVGLHNYSIHPTTRACMFGWSLNDAKISLWEILRGEVIPKILLEAIKDPNVMFAAWNSPFERYIFKYAVGYDIPICRWLDPQASARYLSLPDDLETAAIALGLPREFHKDKNGEQLIKVFSQLTIPRRARIKKGCIGITDSPVPYFRDYGSDPLLWDDFGQYCIQDVAAEREIARRLRVFGTYPLPERERRIWELDQKINDFGMPTDREFVQKNYRIGVKAADRATDKLREFTGLENPRSQKQMLEWVRAHGYGYNTLRKEYVTLELDDAGSGLTEEARKVLDLRKIANSTSYKKLQTIEQQLSPDNRLRNQFIYMGSSRAGRWSSAKSQLHNMARPMPMFEEEENLNAARELIYAEDYQGLVNRFGEQDVMSAVKSNTRSCFVAQ